MFFCGNTEAGTDKEHVIPKWVKDCLPPPEGHHDYYAWSIGGKRVQWFSDEIGWKTTICKACHHGWMGELEDAVRPFLCSMIGGRTTLIAQPQVANLAGWFMKLALLLPYLVPRPEPFPQSFYEFIRTHKVPDKKTAVWIGAYSLDSYRIFAEGRRLFVPTEGKSLTTYDTGLLVTIAIGHVVLKIESLSAVTARRIVEEGIYPWLAYGLARL
jgi:hypothetical protein